jgi:hypothetical protein
MTFNRTRFNGRRGGSGRCAGAWRCCETLNVIRCELREWGVDRLGQCTDRGREVEREECRRDPLQTRHHRRKSPALGGDGPRDSFLDRGGVDDALLHRLGNGRVAVAAFPQVGLELAIFFFSSFGSSAFAFSIVVAMRSRYLARSGCAALPVTLCARCPGFGRRTGIERLARSDLYDLLDAEPAGRDDERLSDFELAHLRRYLADAGLLDVLAEPIHDSGERVRADRAEREHHVGQFGHALVHPRAALREERDAEPDIPAFLRRLLPRADALGEVDRARRMICGM